MKKKCTAPTKGKLVEFESHSVRCEYQKILCTFCKTLFHLSSIEDHKKTCPLRTFQCDYCKKFEGVLSLKLEHYKVCPMHPVFCPNHCGAKLYRKNVLKHHGNCPMFLIPCPDGCGENIKRKDINKHQKKCCLARVQCSNGCGTVVARKKLGKHILKCPREVLDCPYKRIGCRKQVTREKLSLHVSTCECIKQIELEKQELSRSRKEITSKEALLEQIKVTHQHEIEKMEEQLKCKERELESYRRKESVQEETKPVIESEIDGCMISSVICVANLPPHSSTVTLRNLFEHHGAVKYIFPINHLNMAVIKFAEEKYARSALLYSKETGFLLNSNELCVSAVHMY